MFLKNKKIKFLRNLNSKPHNEKLKMRLKKELLYNLEKKGIKISGINITIKPDTINIKILINTPIND